MAHYRSQAGKVVLAISLLLLAGGIIGSIYGFVKIERLLSGAEETGDPIMTPAYNYQKVAPQVESLGLWGAASATVAAAGALSGLAHLFLPRRGWLRRAIFACGAFLMLVGIPLSIVLQVQRSYSQLRNSLFYISICHYLPLVLP